MFTSVYESIIDYNGNWAALSLQVTEHPNPLKSFMVLVLIEFFLLLTGGQVCPPGMQRVGPAQVPSPTLPWPRLLQQGGGGRHLSLGPHPLSCLHRSLERCQGPPFGRQATGGVQVHPVPLGGGFFPQLEGEAILGFRRDQASSLPKSSNHRRL